MPKIAPLPRHLRRWAKPAAPPKPVSSKELASALATMLRKVGLVGKDAPGPAVLVRLAKEWAKRMVDLDSKIEETDGVMELAEPIPEIDDTIPF